MARIEKTVFISYRRADVYTALAVYENLKNQGYDVFFDYRSISSGDFEQIITSNIRARAHFVLILTPTALDRCNEPGDWLRREIEIAIDEKRNIVPLFFRGFRFGAPSITDKLTGKLRNLSRYNGLNVHEDYFDEAMQRLRTEYLNKPLDTVLHPVSSEVQRVVKEEQVAADKALEQIEDVQELVKHTEEKPVHRKELEKAPAAQVIKSGSQGRVSPIHWRRVGLILGGLLTIALLFWAGSKLLLNLPVVTSEPTFTSPTNTISPLQPNKTDTPSPTQTITPPTSVLPVGAMRGNDGMILLSVQAGGFTMGRKAEDAVAECGQEILEACPLDLFKNQEPPHEVFLDSFWIDQTEVTNAMYAKCVDAGSCEPPESTGTGRYGSYYGNSTFDNFPVTYIDWDMARNYCEWIGRRLPTEAEWEKAARGTDDRIYPWGNSEPHGNLLNFYSDRGPSKVGSYPTGASPYGMLDMAGNVWEWVNDWYSETYYSSSPTSNPPGPDTGQEHVLRGGGWQSFLTYPLQAPYRAASQTYNIGGYEVGFRCAMSATP